MLTAVLREIDALVSGDTGVAHLAAALGTPVVTLFGPTDPALSAPRGPAVVVRHAVPCSPCFYRECPIEHPCLRDVTAAEVHARLQTLLTTERSRSTSSTRITRTITGSRGRSRDGDRTVGAPPWSGRSITLAP
jgi:heptosyltransferase-2